MCSCMRISNRAQCFADGLSIVVACCVALSFIIYRARYDINNCILFTGLILTISGALCLIAGAVLKTRVLLWAWVAVSVPATLLVIVAYGLILHRNWDDTTTFSNAVDIILMIIYICMILHSICRTLLFLRELSRFR